MASVSELLGQTATVQGAYKALEALIALAFTDPTTNLPNRRALDEVANLSVGFEGPGFGVVMIDLTGFKRVNDEGTHAAGDAALGRVGSTLLEICRPGLEAQVALPFRYGGDEFCILVPAPTFDVFVEEANLARLSWPDFTLQGKSLGFSAAVGFTPPDDECGLNILIERADAAAKASKQLKDRPVAWTATLAQEEVLSMRRRCASCSATITIQVAKTALGANFFTSCANCLHPMSA